MVPQFFVSQESLGHVLDNMDFQHLAPAHCPCFLCWSPQTSFLGGNCFASGAEFSPMTSPFCLWLKCFDSFHTRVLCRPIQAIVGCSLGFLWTSFLSQLSNHSFLMSRAPAPALSGIHLTVDCSISLHQNSLPYSTYVLDHQLFEFE